ncbi:unnamed protein product, partial [Ascophyllum nodosum]
EPEHLDPSSAEFYVTRVGYQAYCEYQVQLLRDVDGAGLGCILSMTDETLKPYYGLRLSP